MAEPIERIYTIPLRKAFRKPRTKRAPYSMRIIREFLARHMKVELDKIKIGEKLNQSVWARGIQKPPRRVRIKAILDDEGVKAELVGHEYKVFKPEKIEEKKEGVKEKIMKRLGPKAVEKQKQEEIIEGKAGKEKHKIEKPVKEKRSEQDVE